MIANLLLRARNPLLAGAACRFARRKDTEKEVLSDNYVRETVEIEEKYREKSAILYDQYMKERERPALTLDNHQIRYSFVLERPPIFVPYHPRKFEYYRSRYNFLKKTGYYMEVPKELQMETGDYLFSEYERVNPENTVTHRNILSKTEVYEYSENSRYWRYTDPAVQDPHSIQTYSSDNVFLLVQEHSGEWVPSQLCRNSHPRLSRRRTTIRRSSSISMRSCSGGRPTPSCTSPSTSPSSPG